MMPHHDDQGLNPDGWEGVHPNGLVGPMSAGNLNSSPLLKIITSVWEVVFVMDLASSVIFKSTWNSFCSPIIAVARAKLELKL
jgi:hypothetical protein